MCLQIGLTALLGKNLCKTDIQIEVPKGTYGRVAPRSGLAHKHFIDVGAGVIDEDYRGNVGVILFNFGEHEFAVKNCFEMRGSCYANSLFLLFRLKKESVLLSLFSNVT